MKYNVKLTLSYEGTLFFGWQNNRSARSVEGELEKALLSILGHKVVLQAASRTDRGVHANVQVVNFFIDSQCDLPLLTIRLNNLLDEDLRVLKAERTQEQFHPTLDATAKQYRYIIATHKVRDPLKRRISWHFPYITSLENMKEAASQIIGRHDFLGFSHADPRSDTVRTIYSIEFEEFSSELHIVIKGDHFLHKMVRIIVGTLAYIGCGKLDVAVMGEILVSKDRKKAGITSPPEGLFLDRIFYPL